MSTKRRVPVESERKYWLERNYMLTVEEALSLLGHQLHLYNRAMRSHVPDQETARKFAREIAQELARRFREGDEQTPARLPYRPRKRGSAELPRHIKEQLLIGLAPSIDDLKENRDPEC